MDGGAFVSQQLENKAKSRTIFCHFRPGRWVMKKTLQLKRRYFYWLGKLSVTPLSFFT